MTRPEDKDNRARRRLGPSSGGWEGRPRDSCRGGWSWKFVGSLRIRLRCSRCR